MKTIIALGLLALAVRWGIVTVATLLGGWPLLVAGILVLSAFVGLGIVRS